MGTHPASGRGEQAAKASAIRLGFEGCLLWRPGGHARWQPEESSPRAPHHTGVLQGTSRDAPNRCVSRKGTARWLHLSRAFSKRKSPSSAVSLSPFLFFPWGDCRENSLAERGVSSPAASTVTTERQRCRGGGSVSPRSKPRAFCSHAVTTDTVVRTHEAHTPVSSLKIPIKTEPCLHPKVPWPLSSRRSVSLKAWQSPGCDGRPAGHYRCQTPRWKQSRHRLQQGQTARLKQSRHRLQRGHSCPSCRKRGCACHHHPKGGCPRGGMTHAMGCRRPLPA